MVYGKITDYIKRVSLGTFTLVNMLGPGHAVAWHNETHKPTIEYMQREAKPVADLAKRVHEAIFDACRKAPGIIKIKEWGGNAASIGYEVIKPDKAYGVYADARADRNFQPIPEKLSKYLPIREGNLLTLFIPYGYDNRAGKEKTLLDRVDDGVVIKFLIGEPNLIYNVSDSKAGLISMPSGAMSFDVVIGERLEGLSDEQRKHYLLILEAHLQLFMAELNKAVQEAQASSPQIQK